MWGDETKKYRQFAVSVDFWNRNPETLLPSKVKFVSDYYIQITYIVIHQGVVPIAKIL